MTRRICVSLLALWLVAGVCLAAAKSIPDDLINDQVRLKLANDPDVKGGALKVDVKLGVVTLNGQVDTQSQKDKATKLAKRVKGVKSVVNNIEVKRRG